GWKLARRRPALAGLLGVSSAAVITLVAVILIYNANLRVAALAALEREEQARAASERAERNFGKARSAVDRMLTEVADFRWRNEPRLDAQRRQLLEQALTFYQGFIQERSTDPDIQLETAHAY